MHYKVFMTSSASPLATPTH